MKKLFYTLFSSLILVGSALYSPTPANAQPALSYEADIVNVFSGHTVLTHVLQSGTKFKIAGNYAIPGNVIGNKNKTFHCETYFDGNAERLVFYYFNASKSATLSQSTLLWRINDLVKIRGKERVKKDFDIPEWAFNGNELSTTSTLPRIREVIETSKSLSKFNTKSVGNEIVGDYLCETLSRESVNRAQTVKERFWLHRTTGLILKHETITIIGDGKPNYLQTITVSNLKFRKSIPDSKFRLPSGTEVEMPQSFDGVKLGTGLIRTNPPGTNLLKGGFVFDKTPAAKVKK